MKENCIIKSGACGITLVLNPSSSIEDILLEICRKFADQRKFFGKTSLVLTIAGRQLSDEEFEAVIQSIEYNSDVKIDLILEKNQMRDVRTRNLRDQFYTDNIRENGKMVLGPVRDGERITSDSSLIVLGDTEEGSEISAAGSIIVTGQLRGEASAGIPSNDDCFIYASEFLTETLTIGNHEGDLPPKKKSFFRKKEYPDGEVFLYRQDHFILTNGRDEILSSYFHKQYRT